MTHTKDEALKLALEALEESKTNNDTMEFHDRKNKAITAIKQALAAPVQEPVSAECKFEREKEWGRCSIEHHNLVQSEPHKWPDYQTRLLYTTPPATQP